MAVSRYITICYTGFEVLTAVVVTSCVFWGIKPCSPLQVNLLATFFMLVYFSAPKMEATCSFETSVDFERSTRHLISERKTICNYQCEKLISYI
jgi:hypothetical protein